MILIDLSYSSANQTSVRKHALTNISNNNEEFTENNADMLNLETFENDVKYLRFATLDGADKYDYKIPKDSDDFVLKSGIVKFLGTSNMSNKSRGSIGSGLNKSFELSMIGGDSSGLNGQIRKQNSIRKSSFIRSNTGNLQHHVKKGEISLPGSPIREREDATNVNNSSFISDQSSFLLGVPEAYEEEVSLMDRNNKLKKYTLFLVRFFAFREEKEY